MPDVAVLGVDIASARWADDGTALVGVSRDTGRVTCVVPGVIPWPDAPLTPSALADAIHACAVRTGAVVVALDGPHAWRDPARSADEPGVGRRAEFAVRAQCKTGVYPRTYPGTQAAWTRFSIAVFDALLTRAGVRMASPEDAVAPVSAEANEAVSAGYLLLESYPTAIWRAAGLAPLPAKSRRPDVPAFYARLAEAFALPHAVVTSHDDLQAVVAAMAAVGVTGVAGAAAGARAYGEPARVVPHADGAHRVEGFIWDAAASDARKSGARLNRDRRGPGPGLAPNSARSDDIQCGPGIWPGGPSTLHEVPMTHRRTRARMPALLLAALCLAGSACAVKGAIPATNIVMAHSRGWAVAPDPKSGYPRLTAQQYDAYLDALAADMQSFCTDMAAKAPGKPCQILFFVHGGMNTRNNTVQRAVDLHERIMKAGVYPVFLNWRSSFPSSWWDHLAKVRKGLWSGRNVAFTPLIFASDQIRAIPEAPAAWVAEVRHAVTTIGPHNPSVKAYAELQTDPDGLSLNPITKDGALLDDRAGAWERNRSWLALPLTLPVKLVSAPFIIQPWGSGAWDVMLRRTDMLFRTEEAFRGSPLSGNTDTPVDAATGAAFAHFLQRFEAEFMPRLCGEAPAATTHVDDVKQLNTRVPGTSTVNCRDKVRLSLVGHSMGSIVVNEALRQVPKLEVANIVYMAAATTVRDYRDTILPYLRAHWDSEMFHLVLHPQAEVKERGTLDLAPRGSLLVWIDNYFSNPVSPLDRTAGRFFNLAQELPFTDADVRSRVHVKVFRVGQRVRCWNPQKHSDFGDFPYWDRSFWDPAVDSVAGGPARWKDEKCDANHPAAEPTQQQE